MWIFKHKQVLLLAVAVSTATAIHIQCKQAEPPVVHAEPVAIEPVTIQPEVITAICPVTVFQEEFYPVPLDIDLQAFIINECESYRIDPSLVMAVIERESNFQPDAVGDNGNSLGLMQIQPRWHKERMESRGCTDLLNPYDNVTVGINFLAELLAKDKGDAWSLMAYNGGMGYANWFASQGEISDYAAEVMERYCELHEKRGESDVLFG